MPSAPASTAAGACINYWWPQIPAWFTAATALAVLFVAKLVSVKLFGELEFWFATIKVVAILAMIVIGVGVGVGVGVLTFGFSSAGETASSCTVSSSPTRCRTGRHHRGRGREPQADPAQGDQHSPDPYLPLLRRRADRPAVAKPASRAQPGS